MIKLLMIQPESRGINFFRRLLANYHSVLTIPYLAGFVDERHYEVTIIDEYSQRVPYEKNFDLVAITINTPNALHCYEISAKFRASGAKVVMGGPHATLVPDDVRSHCDYLVVGEGEITWPQFLEDFKKGAARGEYMSDAPPQLQNLPRPRWDIYKRRLKKARYLPRAAAPTIVVIAP